MNKRGQMFVIAAVVVILLVWMVTTTYNSVHEEVALEDFNELSSNYQEERPKVINYAIDQGAEDGGASELAEFTEEFVDYAQGSSQPNFGIFNIVKVGEDTYEIQNFLPEGRALKLIGSGLEDQLITLSFNEQTGANVGMDIGGQIFYNKVSTDVVNFDEGYASATFGNNQLVGGNLLLQISGIDQTYRFGHREIFRGTSFILGEGGENEVAVEIYCPLGEECNN